MMPSAPAMKPASEAPARAVGLLVHPPPVASYAPEAAVSDSVVEEVVLVDAA